MPRRRGLSRGRPSGRGRVEAGLDDLRVDVGQRQNRALRRPPVLQDGIDTVDFDAPAGAGGALPETGGEAGGPDPGAGVLRPGDAARLDREKARHG